MSANTAVEWDASQIGGSRPSPLRWASMTLLLGLIAFLGFCLSFVVHVSALLGVDVSAKAPYVWLLHVGIFVVFIPLVISSRKAFGANPSFSAIRAAFPAWVVALGIVIFAYAALNFLLFILATDGGSPSIKDGKFILQSHGQFIRELSSAEYATCKANEVRGFSGHWLAFYFVPFVYFIFRRRGEA